MAILRGVESGFSIARSAKLGILTATDDRGRVLAQRKRSARNLPQSLQTYPSAMTRQFIRDLGTGLPGFVS